MDNAQLKELLLQSLEHEMGGVKLYKAALECCQNDDLKEEWEKYLAQTRTHVTHLRDVFEIFGIGLDEDSPGRQIVKEMGEALLSAIKKAQKNGDPTAAEVVATECIVLAEIKDHLNWELLGECASKLKGKQAKALRNAYEEVEDEEDEHLYHTKGWCRELWMQSLGLKAILPPPEERKHVRTAIGAARAEHARKQMS